MKKLTITFNDLNDSDRFDKLLDICNPGAFSRMRMDNKPTLLNKSNRSIQISCMSDMIDHLVERLSTIIKSSFNYMVEDL